MKPWLAGPAGLRHRGPIAELRGGQGAAPLAARVSAPHLLRRLAISGTERNKGLPNLPTFQEQGFTGFGLAGWIAAYAPAATPKAVAAKLASTFREPAAARCVLQARQPGLRRHRQHAGAAAHLLPGGVQALRGAGEERRHHAGVGARRGAAIRRCSCSARPFSAPAARRRRTAAPCP
ncbi:hypothetical protein EZ313_21695 [Ramlibacter henchirensis]|uniref:Uncharacterized protein n=1 Tax=Ramlibacter henchirensis TaxID=204072 RepID=A0A4Z0BML8_9BURK|nr:hypothetical protein EZ313_21695 [Ramlibacter henchirensis]